MGGGADVALETADFLGTKGVVARVVNMHTIKPIDAEEILKSARQTKAMVTVEEHSIIGGLGSAVAEVLAEGRAAVPFKRFGIRDAFCHGVGSQNYHLKQHGITVDAIAGAIFALLGKR